MLGSGQFVCLRQGDIYMKKLQGVHFAMDGLVGDVETESVYCKDVVYTNELGNVTTGIVNAGMLIFCLSYLKFNLLSDIFLQAFSLGISFFLSYLKFNLLNNIFLQAFPLGFSRMLTSNTPWNYS